MARYPLSQPVEDMRAESSEMRVVGENVRNEMFLRQESNCGIGDDLSD